MKFYFLALIGLIPLWMAGQSPYTLEQLLAATDAHLPLAQQQPMIEAAHRAALAQLRTNYLPQAALNGQATWQSDVTGLPIRLPNIEVPTLDRDQYRVTLDVSQSLWDGGQTARLSAVQTAQTKVEQQRLQTDRYAAREQTMQLYCAAILSERQLAVLAANKKDLIARKNRLEEQVANGVAIAANVEVFEARLLELEQQEAEAVARKVAATDGLALLSGLSVDAHTAFSLPQMPAPTADTTLARPELALFALQQQSAKAQEAAITARNMPRVNAIATLGYARPGLNFLSNEFSPYAILGLNFRWNLSPLYTGSAQKEREQLQVQQARIGAQQAQFSLQTRVRQQQFIRETERLQQVLAIDRKIIALRNNVVATAGVQLENGVITPSDYLAESTLASAAQLQASIHEVQLWQAQLSLLFINGKL